MSPINLSIMALCAGCAAMVAAPPASGAPTPAPAPAAANPAPKLLELPFSAQPDVWVQGEAPASWLPRELYVYECWATWCGPCVAAMPHLEELHRSLSGENNIHILGINLESDITPDRLRQFLAGRLKVTFPMAIASQKTHDEWMQPLNVRTIPCTFAVRDGKVVWKGSPLQVNADMLKRLAQGLPASDPAEDPAKKQRDMLAGVRGIFEALAKNDVAEAKRIAAAEDARQSTASTPSHSTTVFLIRAMVSNRHAAEAIDVAAELARQHAQDAAFLATLVNALSAPILAAPLTQETRPALEAALAYALQQADLEQQAGKKGRRTLLVIADLLEKLDRRAEARPYLLRAITRSEYGIVWDLIGQKTGEALPLADVLQGSVAALVAEENRQQSRPRATTPTRWEHTAPNDPMNDIFRLVEWEGTFRPQGPPAGETLLVSFWKNQRSLDAQLKLRGWNRPNLYRAIILCGHQLSPPTPNPDAPWPTGRLTDPAPLLRLLGHKSTSLSDGPPPEAALWRDGPLLWVGDVAYMPAWVGKVLDEKHFDYARFQSERKDEEQKLDRARDILRQALALNKEKKWDESCRLLENHLDELYCYPGIALHAEEQLAGVDYRKKNYAAAGRRFEKLMNRYPLEFTIYSTVNKLIGSDERLLEACYPAAMQALQGMADTNLRADPEYNAACYTVMAQLALQKGQETRARELCLRALAASPIVRRFLTKN